MKILLILLLSIPTHFFAQCTFEYYKTYSGSLCDEDYMDVFDLPSKQQIIAIGISQNREGVDTNECNYGFLFRKFDYCGNILKERIYGHFESIAFTRSIFSKIDNGTSGPGRSSYNITHKEGYSYFIGFALDTLGGQYNVLLVIDEEGEIVMRKNYYNGTNANEVQHIVLFRDGRILTITDSIETDSYTFNWLNKDGDIRKKVMINTPEHFELFYAKESSDGQLYFTGNKSPNDDPSSISVLKIDTLGNVVWSYEANGDIGRGRDIFIKDSSILICALHYDSIRGANDALVLLELNLYGIEISRKIVKIDGYDLAGLSMSMVEGSNNNYYVATNLYPINKNGLHSVSIISLNQDYNLNWYKYFYKKDNISFGYKMAECSDGGLVIIGEERHQRPNEYGSVIIKTTSDAPVGTVSLKNEELIAVYPNPVHDYLKFPIKSYFYSIYSSDGKQIKNGFSYDNEFSASEIPTGVYILKLINTEGRVFVTRFIKN